MLHDTHPVMDSDELELEREAFSFFQTLDELAASGAKRADVTYGSVDLSLEIPPLGEGDRGLVYRLLSHSLNLPLSDPKQELCVKVAKQEQFSRERLKEEIITTNFFLSEQVAVPRIYYLDPLGRFSIKEYIEGESLTSLYLRFDTLTVRSQSLILKGLEKFLTRLLELFEKRPDCKVSISPNNIYVLSEEGRFRDPVQFVLIDPGTSLNKSYHGYNFQTYWNNLLPDRIRKYKKTGYLQWLVPRSVTRSDRDLATESDIFRGMNQEEIGLILRIARTVEFDTEEIILREGNIGDSFYLILEGEIELRKGHYSEPGSWKPHIGPGVVLGEIGFLLQVPRSMTAVAIKPCKLIEIDRDHFDGLLSENSLAPYKLLGNIAVILAERLHLLTNAYQQLLSSKNPNAQ